MAGVLKRVDGGGIKGFSSRYFTTGRLPLTLIFLVFMFFLILFLLLVN